MTLTKSKRRSARQRIFDAAMTYHWHQEWLIAGELVHFTLGRRTVSVSFSQPRLPAGDFRRREQSVKGAWATTPDARFTAAIHGADKVGQIIDKLAELH